MIADANKNKKYRYKKQTKKISPTVTAILLRGRKLIIPFVFKPQSYCKVPKTKRLHARHSFYHENVYQKRTTTNSIKSLV